MLKKTLNNTWAVISLPLISSLHVFEVVLALCCYWKTFLIILCPPIPIFPLRAQEQVTWSEFNNFELLVYGHLNMKGKIQELV